MPDPMHKPPELIRGLGVAAATSVVVGTIIGTGIFLVSSSMIGAVQSPSILFLVWIVGGFLSLFGALGYAELGAMMPEAGGEYVYLRRAYGNLPAYLYGWTLFSVAKPGSIAALGTGFALFLTVLFPPLDVVWKEFNLNLGFTTFQLRLGGIQVIALAVIMFLSWVNLLGVRTSGRVQTVFTVLKVGAVLALIVLGLGLGQGDWSHFGRNAAGTLEGGALALFGVALIQALWAYDGWNNVSMVGGEVQNPQRNIPLALIFGTALVGVLYILANVAYFYILPPDAIASSSRVASDVAQAFLGSVGAKFIALAAVLSTFAALNGSILSGSRVPYAVSRDGLFFSALGRIHHDWHTPHVAIIVQAAIALVLVFSGTYSEIVTYVIFSEWVFYALVTGGILRLRRQEPDAPRPYRTWGYPWVPALFILASLLLLLNILYKQPRESGFGLLVILAGLLLYPFFRK